MPPSDQARQIGSAPRAEPSVTGAVSGENIVPTGSTQRNTIVFLGLGLLGGIAGGIAVEQTHDFFPVVEPEGVAGNGILTADQLAQVAAARVRADYQNLSFALGLLGLAVGACLGLAQRALRQAVLPRLLVGGMSGAVLGATGGLAAVFTRERLRGWNTLDETGQPDALLVQLHTMAVQLPAWIGIAVAVGLTAGVLARRGAIVGRTAGMAIVAVLLASLVYPLLASMFFATQDSGGVIPSGMANRLFWATLYSALIGLIVGGSGGQAVSRPAPTGSESKV